MRAAFSDIISPAICLLYEKKQLIKHASGQLVARTERISEKEVAKILEANAQGMKWKKIASTSASGSSDQGVLSGLASVMTQQIVRGTMFEQPTWRREDGSYAVLLSDHRRVFLFTPAAAAFSREQAERLKRRKPKQTPRF